MSHPPDSVTQPRTAEEERDWLVGVLGAQTELHELFIRSGADWGWWDAALRKVLALTECEFGFLGRIRHDADGTPYLHSLAITDIAWNEWSRQVFDQFAVDGLEFRNPSSLFGVTMTTGETLISNAPADDPRRCGLPPGHPPLVSYMGIPLRDGAEAIGMLGLANRPGGFAPGLETDLMPLLSVLAAMIARDGVERRAAELGSELEALTRAEHDRARVDIAVRDALAAHSLGAASQVVVYALAGLEDGVEAAVLTADPDDAERLRAASGGVAALARTECVALQSGHTHMSMPGVRLGACAHADGMDAVTICCPISTEDDEYGLLQCVAKEAAGDEGSSRAATLAQSAERLAGALAQVALREAIASRALRDALTGLPNRTALLQAVERRLGRIEAAARPFGVLIVDLDDFKDVNDRLGHAVGDDVLVAVGSTLAAHVRDGDVVARLGGDEFVVLLDSGDPDAMRLAGERLIDAVSALGAEGGPRTGASAGGVPVGWGEVSWEQAYRQADACLYQAKRNGKGRVVVGPALGTARQA